MSGNHPHTRVFVYGSLLERGRQLKVVGRELRMLPARLPGFERRRERYYYIVPRADTETAGAILLGLDARDLSALDRYEEVPTLYTREIVTALTAAGGQISCWCYMPTASTQPRRRPGGAMPARAS
ncbi:MAG TPA: gamma-glutamylcyclotransferase family protein [Candidatus Binataceae bacterium]